MNAKWEKVEKNVGVLTVEVDAERVNDALDKAFQKVKNKVSIPGFRKGKVPRKIFEQRFGVEALFDEALDILIPEAYANAVEKTGIEPVDRPEVDIKQMEKGANLIFTAKVTVKPEVQLGEYKGLEVEELDTTVTDEDVENELKALQERQAELVVVEDGEAQKDDTVVIDFEGFIDGKPFEGGKEQNYPIRIGSGIFIPGFEEQIIGLKAGEEKEINVTFPEEYHKDELAGKDAVFKIKVHEIKRKQLPEIDDEFAKDVDEEVETLAQLKEKIKEQLKKGKEEEAQQHVRDTLVEKAAENATIDIPEVMIKNEVDAMMAEFEQNLRWQGLTLDLYYKYAKTDEERLREDMKKEAEKRIRYNLTLEAIAKAENLEVTEEDVEKEIEKISELYQRPVEEMKEIFSTERSKERIKYDLRIQKAVDFLVENRKK